MPTPTLVKSAEVTGGLVSIRLGAVFVGQIVLSIAFDLLHFSVFAETEQHT